MTGCYSRVRQGESGHQRTDTARAPELIGGKASTRRCVRSAPGAIPRPGALRASISVVSCATESGGASGEGSGLRGRGGAAGSLRLWLVCGGAVAAHRGAPPGGSDGSGRVPAARANLQGPAVGRAEAVGPPGQGGAGGRPRLWPACSGASAARGGVSPGGAAGEGGVTGRSAGISGQASSGLHGRTTRRNTPRLHSA